MTLEQLQAWAQSQINNSAKPEVRPDVGVSVLQMADELERLQEYVRELEEKLATLAMPKS